MNAWSAVRGRTAPWMVHGAFGLLLVLAVAGVAGEGRVLAGLGGLLLGVLYAAGVVPFEAESGPARVALAVVTLGWGLLAMASAWYVLPAVPLVFAWTRLAPLWAAMFGVTLLGCTSVLSVSRQVGGVSALAVLGPLVAMAVAALLALRRPEASPVTYALRAPGGRHHADPGTGSGTRALPGGGARHGAVREPDHGAGHGGGPRAGHGAAGWWAGEAGEPEAAPGQPAVRRSSLVGAVRRLSEATAGRTRIPVRFGVSGTPVELSPAHDAVLLRVARGALGNVGRHSGARNAGVTLTYLDGLIMLGVSDDGRGFDPYTTTGRDLRDLRARVEALGGTLTVRSVPGGGTAVVAGLPR
ncbi:sensor histidine kinase [Nonomuraea indica]|uniref:sensor histidine kinase n=1 Tax=Nonomuraea indica TaxID=1581193 RepID=UPI001183BDDE|nr:ATP-binding protein [Nonomuraea indica]